MTGRALCQFCERVVPDDRPHTCYDAAQAIAIADAERAVVEAAIAWAQSLDRKSDGPQREEAELWAVTQNLIELLK